MYAGKWGYSRDGEIYHGMFDTPEEAAAESHVGYSIGQYREPIQPEHCIDIECLLEQVWACDDYSGDWAEDSVSPNREQEQELNDAVRQVMAKWLDKHDLRPKFGMIDENTVRYIKKDSELPTETE